MVIIKAYDNGKVIVIKNWVSFVFQVFIFFINNMEIIN